MIRSNKFTIIACTLGLLAGCETTMQLNEANTGLVNAYKAKSEAGGDPVLEEAAIASLRDLGKEAAERAEEVEDPLNKIAFYRVASTAAWQAGDVAVVNYAASGAALCEDHWSKAPRDCGMLTLMGAYAGVDETTASFEAVSQPPVDSSAAEGVFKSYINLAMTLIEDRALIESSSPQTLLVEYDERLDMLVCSHIGIGALGLVAPPVSDIDAQCHYRKVRFHAVEAGADLSSCGGTVPDSAPNCAPL